MRARLIAAGAFCIVASACGLGPVPPASAGPTTSVPARAEDSQGSFRLVLELPKTEWHTNEAITGEATLSVIGSEAVYYGSSGSGPILFSFDQLDGNRHMSGPETADCRWRRLEPGIPVSSPIRKSGPGFGPDAKPSDFDRWWATDPEIHLPPGEWRITAIAEAWHAICPGPGDLALRAAIVLHVSA
ncbi:MAG: hypothetical protein ABSC46_08790 [Candidatus Limnocylindrales bacterium]